MWLSFGHLFLAITANGQAILHGANATSSTVTGRSSVLNGTQSSIWSNSSTVTVLASSSVDAEYAVYTPAPWLAVLPQTTLIHVEAITVKETTYYQTFRFALPAASGFATIDGVATASACPVATTVTETVLSDVLAGTRTTITPVPPVQPTLVPIVNSPTAGPGLVSYETSVYTTVFVTTRTIYEIITVSSVQTTVNGLGFRDSTTLTVVQTVPTSTISTVTSLVTLTVTRSAGGGEGSTDNASLSSSKTTLIADSAILSGVSSSIAANFTFGSSARQSAASTTAPSSSRDVSGNPGQFPGSLPTSPSSSISSLSSSSVSPSAISHSSSSSLPDLSNSQIISSEATLSASSASVSSQSTSQSQSASTPSSSTMASTSGSACPIGTIATSATAPAPPAGTNIYSIPGNAPYSTPESELLSMISFPNGFNCNNKLVILQPGTAVPAIDTFRYTFIPAFSNPATIAQIPGGVDIMLVSNPSDSLAPAWKTAEYIAYAMDYAHFVLNRGGTIIAWSQGNLNVQWAFKYWPSTRENVPDRNYVGMSPDYDGTILASFLCEPLSILTSGSGATFANQFISNDGLLSILKFLGIGNLPLDAQGETDPQVLKSLLIALVFGDAASTGFSNASTTAINATSSSAIPSGSSSAMAIPTQGFLNATQVIGGLTGAIPAGKRAVPFGAEKEQVRAAVFAHLLKRQSLVDPLGTLLGNVLAPVAELLSQIIIDPSTPIMQIFSHLATLATDPAMTALPPTGCAPGVWDQTYFSAFVQKLASNGGALAYVPTTLVFSLTDEVVEPQGITGVTAASGYLAGANPGVIAPSNIFIQDYCGTIGNLLNVEAPPLITHEGVLNSGMGVSAAILAVISGSTVSTSDIEQVFGQAEACDILSSRLTPADFLGNEATIPGALLRVTVASGSGDPDAVFVAQPVALPSYSADF